MLKFNF